MGIKKKEELADVDMRYATKRDVTELEKKLLKLIVDLKTGNMRLSQGLDIWSVEIEGLQDDIMDLASNIAEGKDRLDKLETQVAQNKPVSSSDEWYKYKAMRECIHSIGEAIKKYNGR